MAASYTKDFLVSWDEIHRHSKLLAWRLLEKGPVEGKWLGVAAITKGGMIPACVVARELEMKMIDTICVTSYDHKEQQTEAKTLKTLPADVLATGGKGWLIVDDLVDTGNTFRHVRKTLPNAHYACVYAKPEGLDTVDTFITEVSQDTWIHFPWDLEAQYAKPLGAK